MLPNFICPGAQKAATTSLHDILVQHPDIYLPACKETHFFDIDERFARGVQFYEDEYYADARGHRVVGDITPRYLYYHHVPGRIARALGRKVRFVIMLRNPADRAYSHYWMSRGRGSDGDTLEFSEAIARERDMLERVGPDDPIRYQTRTYLDRGFYARQIRRYLAHFDRAQFCFVLFEEFVDDTEEHSRRIFDFLGVDPDVEIDPDKKSNPARTFRLRWMADLVRTGVVRTVSRALIPSRRMRQSALSLLDRVNQKKVSKPPLSTDTRRELSMLYRDDIRDLEDIIGRDLGAWLPGGTR